MLQISLARQPNRRHESCPDYIDWGLWLKHVPPTLTDTGRSHVADRTVNADDAPPRQALLLLQECGSPSGVAVLGTEVDEGCIRQLDFAIRHLVEKVEYRCGGAL